jgi:hypothetical protein
MKYGPPAPCPAHRSFADPSGNILGSILCTGATICPNFFRFSFFYSFFIFSFCYSLLIFPSFLFLFMHIFLSFSSYLFFFFLFFTYYSSSSYSSFLVFEFVYCVTDMHINYINVFQFLRNRCLWKKIFIFKLAKHISVILRGYLRGPGLFWSIWGQN